GARLERCWRRWGGARWRALSLSRRAAGVWCRDWWRRWPSGWSWRSACTGWWRPSAGASRRRPSLSVRSYFLAILRPARVESAFAVDAVVGVGAEVRPQARARVGGTAGAPVAFVVGKR